MTAENPRQLILIDGHAVLYRAYHALPELTAPDGRLVNAVFGFTRVVLTVIRDFEPSHIAVAFDHPKPTFRHTDYVEYKAHRVEMPENLKVQISLVKEVVKTLNIPQFELAGYEADDIIGTLATQAVELDPELNVLIATGDKDSLQLVTDRVHVWMAGRGGPSQDTEYDPDGVVRKMGVKPEQVIDLKALMGDASDNIPGVMGVGAKSAALLITTFGTLDNLYKELDAGATAAEFPVLKKGLVEKLKQGRESAYLSQQLATIMKNVPIQLELAACEVNGYTKDDAMILFEELGFKSLIGLLPADEFELGLQSALF
jgi:DNA polymerase I